MKDLGKYDGSEWKFDEGYIIEITPSGKEIYYDIFSAPQTVKKRLAKKLENPHAPKWSEIYGPFKRDYKPPNKFAGILYKILLYSYRLLYLGAYNANKNMSQTDKKLEKYFEKED